MEKNLHIVYEKLLKLSEKENISRTKKDIFSILNGLSERDRTVLYNKLTQDYSITPLSDFVKKSNLLFIIPHFETTKTRLNIIDTNSLKLLDDSKVNFIHIFNGTKWNFCFTLLSSGQVAVEYGVLGGSLILHKKSLPLYDLTSFNNALGKFLDFSIGKNRQKIPYYSEKIYSYLLSLKTGLKYFNVVLQGKILSVKTAPRFESSESGGTECSKTARKNGKKFGLQIPRGHAYIAGKKPGDGSIITIPELKKNEKPESNWQKISLSDIYSVENVNFADIYVSSKNSHGHRATMFRDDLGDWYVLDPYFQNVQHPISLSRYLKFKKIVKAHFYSSTNYKN